jgi:hypothetical protein
MIDNINKLSANLDTTKQPSQQQTAASIVNLTDDGESLVIQLFFFYIDLDKKETEYDFIYMIY